MEPIGLDAKVFPCSQILLLGLIGVNLASACFPTGQSPIVGGYPGNPLLTQNCDDLILYQRFGRGDAERYQFEYSATVSGSLHPSGSTVTIRCKEYNIDATVYAYDSTSTFIQSGIIVSAVCNPATRKWILNGRDFNQVYCSQSAPAALG